MAKKKRIAAKNELNTILSSVIEKIVKKKVEGVVMMELDAIIDNQIGNKIDDVDMDDVVYNWMEENFEKIASRTKFTKTLQKSVVRSSRKNIEDNLEEWVDMHEINGLIDDTIIKYVHERLQSQLRRSIDGKIGRLIQSIRMGVLKEDERPKTKTKPATKKAKKRS